MNMKFSQIPKGVKQIGGKIVQIKQTNDDSIGAFTCRHT